MVACIMVYAIFELSVCLVDANELQFINGWYHKQIKRNLYGSQNRSDGCWGPTSPEGELCDSELDELHQELPKSLLENEWIDNEWYKDRMVGEDYSRIQIPLLSAGNWVSSSELLVVLFRLTLSTGWNWSASPRQCFGLYAGEFSV